MKPKPDIDPALVAGHSLRRGLATTASRRGKSVAAIQKHGRWKSPAMVGRYIEEGKTWDRTNASSGIGL